MYSSDSDSGEDKSSTYLLPNPSSPSLERSAEAAEAANYDIDRQYKELVTEVHVDVDGKISALTSKTPESDYYGQECACDGNETDLNITDAG